MVAPMGPPAGREGGPTPSEGSLGVAEDRPPAMAGGMGPPVNETGGPPPGALALGGTAELPFAEGVQFQPRHEEELSQQRRVTSTRPQYSKILFLIYMIYLFTPIPTLLTSASNANTKENCARVLTSVPTRRTTPSRRRQS